MSEKIWYRFHIYECPICGRTDEYKEAVKDEPKPKEYEKRHLYQQRYDYCEESRLDY